MAALSPVSEGQTQDVTRLCLTRALTQGELVIEPCAAGTDDRASYEGRTYTDKAPGLSVLALPAAEATRLPPAGQLDGEIDARLWSVRVLTTGVAFLLLAFAVVTFLISALPFLAVGLAPAFARWRLATAVLAAASLVATTVLTLTWAEIVSYRQSAWGELVRVLWQGLGSRLEDALLANALGWLGIGRLLATLVVAACAAAAFVLALRAAPALGSPRRLRE